MESKMDNEMETRVCLGVYMRVILGSSGIMEKKMETTIVYWGYIGIGE